MDIEHKKQFFRIVNDFSQSMEDCPQRGQQKY